MKLFYLLSGFLLSSNILFSQTSITIVADRDNSIYSESTNSNGAGDIFVGVTSGGNKRRGLIHFDLSGIPSDAIIATATLSLFVNKIANGSGAEPVEAHKLNANWGEGASVGTGQGAAAQANDATWVTRFTGTPSAWATPGGDFVASISGSGATGVGTTSISGPGILADVQSWINNPTTNFGWALTGEEASNRTARIVTSRNGTASQQPKLIITYTTLPITLSTFSVQLKNKDAALSWVTATEINNRYFGIEHSTDGSMFAEISKVAGAGNSVLPKLYSFTHSNVGIGKHFYRLAQYDFNGSVHYSQVVAILNGKKVQLQILPNPAQTFIRLQSNELLAGSQYRIINSNGQVNLSGTILSQQIGVEMLAAGNYRIIIVKKSGETIATPFVKQ